MSATRCVPCLPYSVGKVPNRRHGSNVVENLVEVAMSMADQIAVQLPYLRRYARALTGSQSSGDAYVRATLEAALADKELLDQIGNGRVALYVAFNRIWSTGHV